MIAQPHSPSAEDDFAGTEPDALASLAQPHLVAMWPGGAAVAELPRGGTVTVGRSRRSTLCIDHPSVSRDHAVFRSVSLAPDGAAITVEDLGSTNGTTVAGQRSPGGQRTTVTGHQVVTVGAAVIVVREAFGRPAAGAPTAPGGAATGSAGAGGRPVVVVDDSMKELYRVVDLVARGDLSVILLGETGSGKDVLANAIHKRSLRASTAYVSVNCAALPGALLESELFGYERGAFTGAVQAKPGLLEVADKGTLFLDEIAELPLTMQAKLLRVLESREVTRVGGLKTRTIDVRFVCATNRDLVALVRTGAFRQDLYFRLNGISLVIPPLRQRKIEIQPLARAFVVEACREAQRATLAMTAAALEQLEVHAWPGNVRELKNVIDRAVTLCTGTVIDVHHLPPPQSGFGEAPSSPSWSGHPPDGSQRATVPVPPPAEVTPEAALGLHEAARRAAQVIERRRISEAMERCGGNQTRAALLLRISRRTLVARLTEYGFARPIKKN
ncbi:MAG: sigma 54-interacting transcriptional regulator [Polyangiaceae bacterium]